MVTEFAQYGSLMDDIVKRPEPSEAIKTRLMLDAAKGAGVPPLEQDHAPGHQADNFLVFVLYHALDVNGKLTDYGSSRNDNC